MNIKTFARIRPPLQKEKSTLVWESINNSLVDVSKKYSYSFDKVFQAAETNEDVFQACAKTIVEQSMEGFNGTIFAYGQTASGKTYTMFGQKNDGIIPRSVHEVFNYIEDKSEGREFLLRICLFEIYNERIYDLLSNEVKLVELKEDVAGTFIADITEEMVAHPDDAIALVQTGFNRKRTGETLLNERSSRSHTVFRFIIESKIVCDSLPVKVGTLNFVDLAGSEKASQTGAEGVRFREGVTINKSLFTLTNVMRQLADNAQHISFRDSKLTRILQQALGGNSQTAVICNIVPQHMDETLSTLRFASLAKQVTNEPIINHKNENTQIEILKSHITLLQKENNDLKDKRAQEMKSFILSDTNSPSKIGRRLTLAAFEFKNRLTAKRLALGRKSLLLSEKINDSNCSVDFSLDTDFPVFDDSQCDVACQCSFSEDKLSEEIDSKEHTIFQLNEQIQEQDDEKNELIASHRLLKEEIASRDRTIVELNQKILQNHDVKNELVSIHELVLKQKEDIEQLNKDIEAKDCRIFELNEHIQEKIQELAELASIQEINQIQKEDIEKLNKDIETKDCRIFALNEHIQEKIKELAELASIQKINQKQKEAIEQLNKDIEAKDCRIFELNEHIQEKIQELAQLASIQEINQKQKEDIERLNNEIEAKNCKISELSETSRENDEQDELTSIKKVLKKQKEEIEWLFEQIELKERKIVRLEEKIQDQSDEHIELMAVHKMLEERNDEKAICDEEIEKLNTKLCRFENEFEQTATEFQHSLKEKDNLIQETTKIINTKDKEIERLSHSCQEAKDEYETLHQHNNQLQESLEKLRQERRKSCDEDDAFKKLQAEVNRLLGIESELLQNYSQLKNEHSDCETMIAILESNHKTAQAACAKVTAEKETSAKINLYLHEEIYAVKLNLEEAEKKAQEAVSKAGEAVLCEMQSLKSQLATSNDELKTIKESEHHFKFQNLALNASHERLTNRCEELENRLQKVNTTLRKQTMELEYTSKKLEEKSRLLEQYKKPNVDHLEEQLEEVRKKLKESDSGLAFYKDRCEKERICRKQIEAKLQKRGIVLIPATSKENLSPN